MEIALFRILKKTEQVSESPLLLVANHFGSGRFPEETSLLVGILDVAELIDEFVGVGILSAQDASIGDSVAKSRGIEMTGSDLL